MSPSSPDPRASQASTPPDTSRYELLEKLASGGMATVYLGRQRGAEGFWRLVAIKRPHQHLLDDPTFRRMFVDEARLASKIHHPNVVPVLDVEERPGGQLLLVMDYIEGASLADLMDAAQETGRPMPTRNAVRIALDALAGLHAAHELTDAAGRPLRLVHRDVSPHNVMVGVDGTARVADFGIAKSVATRNVTESGVLKGKLAYMAPEYVERQICDARSDVFAMAAVLWEAIAGRRLFRGDSDYDTLRRIVAVEAPPLSSAAPWTHGALDAVLAAALERDASRRTPTARAFGDALEAVARRHDLVATAGEVGDHLRATLASKLAARRERLRTFLDAGITTGPMDAEHVALARAMDIAREPAAAAASHAVAVPRPAAVPAAAVVPPARDQPAERDEPPPSSAMTGVIAGSDLTERALVAAGIRPPRRSSGGLVAAVVLGVALLGGATWWLRSRTDAAAPTEVGPTGASAPITDAAAAPSSGAAPGADDRPVVAPIPGTVSPSTALDGGTDRESSGIAPTSSAPAPRGSVSTGSAPRASGAPVPPPSSPPASPPPSPAPPGTAPPGTAQPTAPPPSGPLRRNPYR